MGLWYKIRIISYKQVALLMHPAKICKSGTKESQLTNPGLVKIVTFIPTL